MRPTDYLFWALKQQRSELKQSDKLVLVILGDMADEKGQSFGSHQYLADRCCSSPSTVKRALKNLESLKLVHVEHQFKAGMKDSNLYTLTPDRSNWPIDISERPGGEVNLTGGGGVKLTHKTPTSFKHPFKQGGGKNQRTRDRSLEEDLADTSWADSR